jgi:sterol desaturase/sphingolipid hydroxylase (fatty acid hydroxylase superfamily)
MATLEAKMEPPYYSRETPLVNALKALLMVLVLVTIIEREKEFRTGFYDNLQTGWKYVWEDLAGKDDWWAFVILTNLYGTIVYWLAGFPFSVLDFGNFEWTKRYKIQPNTNQPVNKNKFIKAVLQVLFNQFVVGPLMASVMMPILRYRGVNFTAENIPGLATFLRHLVGYAVCEEIGFYYSHRLFHEVKPLYIRVHKQHHEWVASIAIAARYAHPLEDVLANVGPVMLGPLVCGSPLVFWWIWLTIALTSTVVGHSGYHFPLLSSPEYHDFHHLRFDTNYGAFGVLDALHNTDEKFRGSIQALRHHTLTSLKSAREEYPDPANPSEGEELKKTQ